MFNKLILFYGTKLSMKNKNNNKNSCNGCHGDCVSDTSVGFKISENFKRFNQKNDIFSRSFWDDQIHSEKTLKLLLIVLLPLIHLQFLTQSSILISYPVYFG